MHCTLGMLRCEATFGLVSLCCNVSMFSMAADARHRHRVEIHMHPASVCQAVLCSHLGQPLPAHGACVGAGAKDDLRSQGSDLRSQGKPDQMLQAN